MKPEQQRIAIAEACGWRKMEAPKELGFGASAPDKCWYFTHQLPDYLSDLNAMHEAEKILNTNQAADYCELLRPIICGCWRLVHATAAQRAEAFLKTLGLWEE
jgi:DNA-binding transcriptional regulator PaaX